MTAFYRIDSVHNRSCASHQPFCFSGAEEGDSQRDEDQGGGRKAAGSVDGQEVTVQCEQHCEESQHQAAAASPGTPGSQRLSPCHQHHLSGCWHR